MITQMFNTQRQTIKSYGSADSVIYPVWCPVDIERRDLIRAKNAGDLKMIEHDSRGFHLHIGRQIDGYIGAADCTKLQRESKSKPVHHFPSDIQSITFCGNAANRLGG